MSARTVVISQPTYLPWIGYLDLIDQSDTFVFLDSVQFAKRSWQQRNRILSPQGELILTVPVLSKGRRDQSICDVEIDPESDFQRRHAASVRQFYRKAPFFDRYAPEYEAVLGQGQRRLADLNIDLIQWLAASFGIRTTFLRSSTLGIDGRKTDLLIDICEAVGATEYLSALASKEYMEDAKFADRSIALRYHNYVHPEYPQQCTPFLPYMSALDLLLNAGGEEGIKILRGGRRHEARNPQS